MNKISKELFVHLFSATETSKGLSFEGERDADVTEQIFSCRSEFAAC